MFSLKKPTLLDPARARSRKSSRKFSRRNEVLPTSARASLSKVTIPGGMTDEQAQMNSETVSCLSIEVAE